MSEIDNATWLLFPGQLQGPVVHHEEWEGGQADGFQNKDQVKAYR